METTYPNKQQLEDYIFKAARSRNIDPSVAIAVAQSEGLDGNPADGWQSNVVKNGKREPSYGPFQLYTGGGLGNRFQEKTGLDPADPANVFKGIDFALDVASKEGWGAWYGAKKIGVYGMHGIMKNGVPHNDGTIPNAPTPGPVTGGSDEQRSYDYYKTTGVNSQPNVKNAGKPQLNIYGHVNWTKVDPQVKDYLSVASARMGIPLNIHSGHRDLSHPSEAKKGPHALHRHTTGKAVDLDIGGYSDAQKQQLITTLVAMGATGVGIYPGGKSLHIDWSGLGTGYKGPGTVSTWDNSGKNPGWYSNGLALGLKAQKEGKLPDGVAFDANIPSGQFSSMSQGGQRADMSWQGGVYPDPVTAQQDYVRGQNDRSIKGLELDGTSYGATIGAAFERSWVLPNLFEANGMGKYPPNPDFDIEKEWATLTKDIPVQYQDQLKTVNSIEEGNAIRSLIGNQMKRDKLIEDNGWTGTISSIFAEILDPVALTAAVATEGALAPYLAAMKVGRIGRALGIGGAAAGGNLVAEGVLDYADPRQHTLTDYGISLGAGLLIGTSLGYFARGNSAIEHAIRDDLHNLGNTIVPPVNKSSAGAQASGTTRVEENVFSNPNQFDFEDMEGAETAAGGRKVGNALKNPVSDPVTKGEKIGAEAFLGARLVMPDPRGARNGEVVERNVVERYTQMFKAGLYDWETTAFAQYKKYAKRTQSGWTRAKNSMGLDDAELTGFFKKVTEYVEETDPIKKAAYDPEVKAVGDKKAQLYSTFRKEGEARRIAGMPLEDNPNYTPLYRDDESMALLRDKFSDQDLRRIVSNEVDKMLDPDGASPALKGRIAEGWMNNITRASLGAQDNFSRVFAKGDRTELIAFLRDELGLVDQSLIDEFMGLNIVRSITQEGTPVTPRVKTRTFDLEGYKTKTFVEYRPDYKGKRTGRGEEVSLRDFFEKNAHAQMTRYMRDMSGVYAFADMRVVNPKTKELILDGVRDDADWAKFKRWIQDSSLAREGTSAAQVKDFLDELDYVYQEIRHAGGSNPRMSKTGRRIMAYTFAHFMQNMGINQAQEFVNIVSGMGLRAAIKGIPAYTRMLNAAGKSVPTDVVMRDLQVLLGRGDNVFMGSRRHYLTEEILGNESASGKAGKVYDKVSSKVVAGVVKISGMEHIDNYLQNWTMRAAAQYFADLASEYGEKAAKGKFKLEDINGLLTWQDAKRLRSLGLSDAKLVQIMNQFRKHSGVTDKKTRLKELNFDKWDAHTLNDLRTALDRWSMRAIQQNDIGSMSRWLSHPVAKFVFQFRSFIFGAYGKQTMYGVNHFDMRTVSTWMLQTMAGAGTWYLFNKAMSLGEKDPDKFMENKLGEEGTWEWYRNMGTAGLNRSGWTSIFPMLYDTAAGVTGAPRLDGRTSGQASAAWGSPVVSLIDQSSKASKDLINSIATDRDQSRQEIKNNVRTIAGNWLPMLAFFGKLSEDRPERNPNR